MFEDIWNKSNKHTEPSKQTKKMDKATYNDPLFMDHLETALRASSSMTTALALAAAMAS